MGGRDKTVQVFLPEYVQTSFFDMSNGTKTVTNAQIFSIKNKRKDYIQM